MCHNLLKKEEREERDDDAERGRRGEGAGELQAH